MVDVWWGYTSEISRMTDEEVLRAFDRIRVWERDGQRAVHKPLLVLLALARLARGEPQMAEFAEIDKPLRNLLAEFGPSSAAKTRHYPFWHLRTDGLWKLDGPAFILNRPPGATPTLTELRQDHVSGGFDPKVVEALKRRPDLVGRLARRIVEAHFPESLQQDVLYAVGLGDVDSEPALAADTRKAVPRRDPSFRERVLRAYEYRCCICGFDLRMGGQVVGLEAAHIKWFQAGGPDVEPNGLALCALHHKLFDLGAFGVTPGGYVVVVSQALVGGAANADRMLSYHGASIILPQGKAYLPHEKFLGWHEKEVFKKPGREL
jgi:putative restriction endonuclease